MVTKIFITQETLEINLQDLSNMLYAIGISKLYLFIIDKLSDPNIFVIKEPSRIELLQINSNRFIQLLSNVDRDFTEYNKNSLYILKDGSYIDIKNMIKNINGFNVNIGRCSGSQKSHIVSPLELRFNNYLLAIHNLNSPYMSLHNAFNYLDKSRYLLYTLPKKKVFKYKCSLKFHNNYG